MGLASLCERDRQKVNNANTILREAVKFVKFCIDKNIPGYIENPKSSRLWKTRAIQRLLKHHCTKLVDLDMCQYGTPWKKPTRLLVFCRHADQVNFQCCAPKKGLCSATHKSHVQLSGMIASGGFQTKQAQRYPRKFAESIVRQIFVPPTALPNRQR